MTILEAILQGILQGLTEFLPVSSSGHLALFQHFFGLTDDSPLFFSLMLHLGTLAAVFVAYFKTIAGMIAEFFRMIGDLLAGTFNYKKAGETRKLVLMVLLATAPLLVFYFIKDWVAVLSEDNDILLEGVCFLITGSLLMIADRTPKGAKTAVDMRARDALTIGVVQGVATLPGISRSGSTISTGMMLGFSREFMVKFSFILGIPAVLGASLSEAVDVYRQGIDVDMTPVIVGVVTSAIVGFFAIKLIQWLVRTDRFAIFAYYTLALGTLVLALGMIETLTGSTIVQLVSTLFGGGA